MHEIWPRLTPPNAVEILVLLILTSTATAADRDNRHDAHVHGNARMNVVLDGQTVHVEFASPAANIVGFEHEPSSTADHTAVSEAATELRAGDRLFSFDESAGCRVQSVEVSSTLLDQAPGDNHAADPADDARHKEDVHDHDDEHREEHGHHDEDHADFEVIYQFSCTSPAHLTRVAVLVFDAFPAIEQLKVQHVTPTRQGAATTTATDRIVTF